MAFIVNGSVVPYVREVSWAHRVGSLTLQGSHGQPVQIFNIHGVHIEDTEDIFNMVTQLCKSPKSKNIKKYLLGDWNIDIGPQFEHWYINGAVEQDDRQFSRQLLQAFLYQKLSFRNPIIQIQTRNQACKNVLLGPRRPSKLSKWAPEMSTLRHHWLC